MLWLLIWPAAGGLYSSGGHVIELDVEAARQVRQSSFALRVSVSAQGGLTAFRVLWILSVQGIVGSAQGVQVVRRVEVPFKLLGKVLRTVVKNKCKLLLYIQCAQAWNSGDEWVLNYYASWCPHCRAFAPTFKDYAQRAADQGSAVRV